MKINQFTLASQHFLMTLALFSFLSLTLINPAMAEEQILRTLTVTGQGVERVPTTLTQVRLGVEIQGKTATEVQEEVAKQTGNVVKLLRLRNVEQLQTTGIRLQPNYDYSDKQRRLIGYTGTNTVSFRLITKQVGTLLDEAVKSGATRIDGVSFTVTEEVLAEAEKKALRQATIDAQAKAEAVFKTLNLTSKEIIRIQVNGASLPPPRPFQAEQLSRASAELSTPVIGGEQIVRASVTLLLSY